MISNLGIHVKPYGRYLVLALIASVFGPGANYVADIFSIASTEESFYWWDIFVQYYGHSILVLTIIFIAIVVGVNRALFFGKRVTIKELIPGMKFICFSVLLSIAVIFALFIPLSIVNSEFVQFWLDIGPDLVLFDSSGYYVLPNVLNFLSIVVITPIVEEVVFRGFLLHRWSYKWSLRTAIIVSSLLFAVVHLDPIGAFIFGVGMCILYLKTQSLLVPILCHSANNLIAWIMAAGDTYIKGPEYEYTLEAFRSEWYIGAIAGVIVIIWTILYFRNRKPQAYELPVA